MTHMIEVTVFAGTAFAMALVAGVFMAFSDFVMRSLRVAAPGAGIEAMQQINREVYGSVFLVGLLGLVPVSLGRLWRDFHERACGGVDHCRRADLFYGHVSGDDAGQCADEQAA
jgi:hypothetical protein